VPENDRLLQSLRELSSLLLSEETLRSILQRVASLSVTAIRACDAAGVSVMDGAQVVTLASSDESVQVVDEIQYRLEQGPCLQAIHDGNIFRIDSIANEKRWPAFVSEASKQGVRTCLAVPLIEDLSTFGALNLYSYRDEVFDNDDEIAAVALAAQASGPLSNMRHFEELGDIAASLTRASASPIDVAIGILMERNGWNRAAAINELRELASMDHGELVPAARIVVESVVRRGDGGA